MNYYPKRPVKSFQDLEVYRKLLAISVVIVKKIPLNMEIGLTKDLHDCMLSLPIKIAAAHSLRFGNSEQAIRILEEIMVGCNKTVVYLELYRDLYNQTGSIELSFFEEQIKNILSTRFKILHLQRSWIKFTPLEIRKNKP